MVVDVDHKLVLGSLVDEAAEDRASRDPLPGGGKVVELAVSARDLDDHVNASLCSARASRRDSLKRARISASPRWSMSGPTPNTIGRIAGSW